MNHSMGLWAALPSCKASDREHWAVGVCWGQLCPGPAARAAVLAQSICPLLLPGCGEGHEAAGCRGLSTWRLRPAFSSCCRPSLLGAGGSRDTAGSQRELPRVHRQQTWGFIDLSKVPSEHGCSAAGSSPDPKALACCVPPPGIPLHTAGSAAPRSSCSFRRRGLWHLGTAAAAAAAGGRSFSGLSRWQLRNRALQKGGHFQGWCLGETEGMVRKSGSETAAPQGHDGESPEVATPLSLCKQPYQIMAFNHQQSHLKTNQGLCPHRS